jgi:hypothetical protein
MNFSSMSRTEGVPNITLLHIAQNYLSNKSLFSQIGLRTRKLRLLYSGDAIYPKLFSARAPLNVFTVTPFTGLQTHWFSMRWKGNLIELMNILFSSFVHLWKYVQNLRKQ